jgi:hypothetical protein
VWTPGKVHARSSKLFYGEPAAGNVLTVGYRVNMDENSQCIVEQGLRCGP